MHATAQPPGPGGLPVGPPYGLGRVDVAHQLLEAARKYGDVVRLSLTSGIGYVISDPDVIKDVLVTHNDDFVKSRALERARRLLGDGLLTSEGDLHLRQRRLIQPAFHRDRINEYIGSMAALAQNSADRIHDGEQVDVASEMMRLTLAIVGKTLFGTDLEVEAEGVADALTAIQELMPLSLLRLPAWFDRLPLPSNLRFWKARDTLDSVIYRIIAAHRRQPGRGDLLSILLDATDEAGDGARMSDTQVRDECMTLLLAGHETTAVALMWTWYLLSTNADAETKLHEEIDRVLDARLSIDALAAMPYAHAVVREALRLYPPAWTIGRRALRPYRIGNYVVPAGSIILISPFVVHRDPRWYRDPEAFDPSRFLGDSAQTRPKFAYIPFGGGQRLCIGEHFAMIEAVVVLATFARRWRLRYASTRAPKLLPLVTLRAKGGMPMIPAKRSRFASPAT